MLEVSKDRLFQESLGQALSKSSKQTSAPAVSLALGSEANALINDRLLDALEQGPDITVEEITVETGPLWDDAQGLKSALVKKRRDGKTEKIIMLRIG